MKINPDRLRTVREKKGFTRPQLEKRSGITVRTIQRLEQEPHRSQKTREDTLNRLAKALSVEPGVLTGDLPLPESDDTLTDNLDRVPIGAQIAPKTRLAYDLIKRRYGVNATEIINMAPLFFVLLAEGSLAQRRKKLQEIEETYDRLYQIDVSWLSLPPFYEMVDHMCGGVAGSEADSIDKADLFGKYLNNDFIGAPFDPSTENPFTHYLRKLADELRKLADELAIPSVVDVDGGVLSIASDFKFPHYDICSEEIDHITNGSSIAKVCLETGCARLSDIPEKLMAEDAGEDRAKWLEDKVLDIFKEIPEKEQENLAAKFIATSPKGDDIREWFENASKTRSKTEKGGDDQ